MGKKLAMRRIYLLLAVISILSGCAINKKSPTAEADFPNLGYAHNPELCLALSGGGLRSAVLSLGALQQLEESGLLNEIDLVGSVSGGGWPVYGLLISMQNGEKLQDLLDEQSDFIKAFDESDFIDGSDIYTIALIELLIGTPFNVASELLDPNGEVGFNTSLGSTYGSEIHQKLLGFDVFQAFKDLPLSEVTRFKENGFPYPVFITSSHEGIRPPKSDHVYSVENLFELSPLWIGSRQHGYQTEFSKYLNIIDVVAASSAASDSPIVTNDLRFPPDDRKVSLKEVKEDVSTLPFLVRRLLPLGGKIRFGEKNLYLADGGFIENTAVLPLLRRKCSNIIAIDARMDPYMLNVEFDLLKTIVLELGGNITLPDNIDTYNLDQKNQIKSKISKGKGWNMPTHYYPVDVELDGFRSRVHFLKLGLVEGEKYPKEVHSYVRANHSEHHSKRINKCKTTTPIAISSPPACGTVGAWPLRRKTCSFPFSGTFLTCYSSEESIAYRHLGKHMINVLLDSSNIHKR